MIRIALNGQDTALDYSCTVIELLRERKLDAQPCAVEVNGEVVPKRRHSEHQLHDGDCVEIVTLVGGG